MADPHSNLHPAAKGDIAVTFLYNCRHAGDQYRITKFDEHMNVESSYTCTTDECDCPAGVRPTCRHRQMLPKFIQREHIGDEWFLDFDRGGWVQMGDEWAKPEPETTFKMHGLCAVCGQNEGRMSESFQGVICDSCYTEWCDTKLDDGEALQSPSPSPEPDLTEAYSNILGEKVTHVHQGVPIIERDELPPLPEGVTMVSLDEGPEAIYNAIADAVGEPRTGPEEKPKAVFIRRRI